MLYLWVMCTKWVCITEDLTHTSYSFWLPSFDSAHTHTQMTSDFFSFSSLYSEVLKPHNCWLCITCHGNKTYENDEYGAGKLRGDHITTALLTAYLSVLYSLYAGGCLMQTHFIETQADSHSCTSQLPEISVTGNFPAVPLRKSCKVYHKQLC